MIVQIPCILNSVMTKFVPYLQMPLLISPYKIFWTSLIKPGKDDNIRLKEVIFTEPIKPSHPRASLMDLGVAVEMAFEWTAILQ